jgi:XTP/dITP diphosphohydrolase
VTGVDATELGRAVALMDRLRSPGGCPWDAAQTHQSLTQYLVEETYEVLEAIDADDPTLLREELGDLLLQVLFHARIAEELPPSDRFDIQDVAADLVAKLIHRHPHVFAGQPVASAEALKETWERQKVVEKRRTSAVDGVPVALPALALAAKLIARAGRSDLPAVAAAVPGSDDEIGERLFAVVRDAVANGVDPEAALRYTARSYRDAIIHAEREATA